MLFIVITFRTLQYNNIIIVICNRQCRVNYSTTLGLDLHSNPDCENKIKTVSLFFSPVIYVCVCVVYTVCVIVIAYYYNILCVWCICFITVCE